MKNYFKDKNTTLINGDSLKLLKKIDNEFENEAFEITKIVLEKANGINESTHHISKYALCSRIYAIV